MKNTIEQETSKLAEKNWMQSALVSRRTLIKRTSLAAGGLSLAAALPGCSSIVKQGLESNGEWQANSWLTIKPTGAVQFTLDRVEMGQGTYTGLSTLLAEELEVAPDSIEVVFAEADTVYRNSGLGLQVTGLSNSILTSWAPLREIGATARMMMLAAASEVMKVPQDQLLVDNGVVTNPATGRSLSYGELVSLASKQDVPDKVALKPHKEFKYIGKTNKRLDSQHKVMGTAGFGIDAKLEGMRYAVVVHSPYIGGQLKDFDAAKLKGSLPEKFSSVELFEIERGVAVVGDGYWQARQAAQSLALTWQPDEKTPMSTESVFNVYREAADSDEGEQVRVEGDIEEGFEGLEPSKILEVEYQAPFLAHATMEPMNCVAKVQNGRADIWTGTQAPDVAQVAVAKVTNVSLADVHIHNQFLGGGFGRRLSQDFVAEAAEIAYKAEVPIKLVWSREDDMRNDLYRPASYHRLKAGIGANNKAGAWQHQLVCPEIFDWYVWDAAPAQFPWAPKFSYGMLGKTGLMTEGTPITPKDKTPYEGAEDLPYSIPAMDVRHTKADAGVPISYWRSVGHSQNAFVTEAFMDELAELAGQDPLEFKLAHLENVPRLKAVLALAAEKGQWGKPSADDRFQGIAVHKSFHSYVAQLVELELVHGEVKVHKVVCAVDCGTVVNPDIVKMQMESGIVFGLTAALYGDIQIKDGQIQQSNFHDYAMLRMNQAPDIEVYIVESEASPTGVGEPGVPPVAPAVAGALYKATGKRFRSMPFKLS